MVVCGDPSVENGFVHRVCSVIRMAQCVYCCWCSLLDLSILLHLTLQVPGFLLHAFSWNHVSRKFTTKFALF